MLKKINHICVTLTYVQFVDFILVPLVNFALTLHCFLGRLEMVVELPWGVVVRVLG